MFDIQASRVFNHFALALGGSFLILAGLYYATANSGHSVDPSRLVDLIKSSALSLLLLYAITMVLGILLRAKRYQILMRASGEQNLPSFKDLSLITAVRNMTVDLLPARMGELVFVYLLNKRASSQYSTGLTTLLFATLLDIVVLAPITILIGLLVGFPSKQPFLLALIALIIVIVFFIGIKFILPYLLSHASNKLEGANKYITKGIGFLQSINLAIQTTIKAGVFWQVFGLTIVVRVLKYGGLLLLYYGLTRGSFPALAELSALPVLGAMIASEMTASLPIPTLMSFGSWELGGMTLLAFYGAVPHNVLLTMLSIHIQTQVLDYVVGIVALFILFAMMKPGLMKSKLQGQSKRFGKSWQKGGLFLLFALGLGGWVLNLAQQPLATEVENMMDQNIAKAVMRSDGSSIPAWLDETQGFIVWSSNRSGNHDIWMMDLPSMRIKPLTNDPHTENFARISPNGKQMVFARSHNEWQSLRDSKPWDIWLLDLSTGKQRLIAKDGTAPSWAPDGNSIIFQRAGGQIMVYDFAKDAGKDSANIYYQSGKDSIPKARVNLSTPTVGREGRMAFTYRDRGRPTNMIRDEKGQFTVVHRDACQVSWSPSGGFVTYVQKGGRQINQIMRFNPESQTKTTLLDLPGKYSHEYFPRLSADEKLMIFAASAGGHEHDLADYELFIWPLGANNADAVRLTFNEGNDSWPDIWLAGN